MYNANIVFVYSKFHVDNTIDSNTARLIEPTVTNCDISDNNSLLRCVIADVTGK